MENWVGYFDFNADSSWLHFDDIKHIRLCIENSLKDSYFTNFFSKSIIMCLNFIWFVYATLFLLNLIHSEIQSKITVLITVNSINGISDRITK